MLRDTSIPEDTTMAEAFANAGVKREETPQKAAERIWKETKHDPVETMRLFEEWARQTPERMLGVLGVLWLRAVRNFLGRNNNAKGAWRYGDSFRRTLARKENRDGCLDSHRREREKITSDPGFRQQKNDYSRVYHKRRRLGRKVVRAEVDVRTGETVQIIDKEYGPFAHIRINGLSLSEVTTEEALRYCDDKTVDVRFIRALCQLIPDPRKPIGEQWTAAMIREAWEVASRSNAA